MAENFDPASNMSPSLNEYYIHKRTGQPLLLYSKTEGTTTLLNPNTLNFYPLPDKEFQKLIAKNKLEKAQYMLMYSFVPHDGFDTKKSLIVSNNLEELHSKLFNVSASITHPSTTLNGESTIFDRAYIKELNTGKFLFTANNAQEFQKEIRHLYLQANPNEISNDQKEKKTFKPSSINISQIMQSIGFKQGEDSLQKQKGRNL